MHTVLKRICLAIVLPTIGLFFVTSSLLSPLSLLLPFPGPTRENDVSHDNFLTQISSLTFNLINKPCLRY